MSVPSEILQAVAANGGGKITLVVGAGCSFEEPTSIPLAATCSQECHDRLVADGVLIDGECASPWNLSCLADAVAAKDGGRQRLLVEQLSGGYGLKTASPNEGHFIAAALLREGAISSVVTLNFDLALTAAIQHLGVGDAVGVIDGPEEFDKKKVVNLYYLHRNANAVDPETWILRTAELATEWKGRWEELIASCVLATPVVVYVGLGSSADVFVESSKLIQSAVPNGTKPYQVDPGEPEKSEFFKALALEPDHYVRLTWNAFMETLSRRLAVEQVNQLSLLAKRMIQREHLAPEEITVLLARLTDLGLLQLGSLRANWMLHDKRYLAVDAFSHDLCADLLLGVALVARVSGTSAILFDDGVVEFRREDRTVASLVFASGRGTRSRTAIEAELSTRVRRNRSRPTQPSGAIISGTRAEVEPATPPVDVVLGDLSDSILFGEAATPVFHLNSLRHDPARCSQVVP